MAVRDPERCLHYLGSRPTHCPVYDHALPHFAAPMQASLGPAAGAACMSMSMDEDGNLGGQGQQPGAGGGGLA